MVDESSDAMIDIATIFSQPELLCFVSALEAEGLIVHICGYHFVGGNLLMVACGGFRVRVPAYQREQAVALIEELRLQTAPLTPAQEMRWGVRMLVGFRAGVAAVSVAFLSPGLAPLFLAVIMSAATTPVPMTMPGDYLNRRGKLVQMR